MRQHLPSLNRGLFPVLAAVGLLFLAWEMVAGNLPSKELWMLGIGAYFLAHGTASNYIELIGGRVEELAIEDELPDWVRGQSEKNQSKAQLYLFWGVVPYLLVAYLHVRGWVGAVWYTGFLAANLAFQVGAFVGEYVVMTAQARLLRDVEGWAKSGQRAAGSG